MRHHWILTIECIRPNGLPSKHTRNGTIDVTGTRQQVFEQLLDHVETEVGASNSCVLFYALERDAKPGDEVDA